MNGVLKFVERFAIRAIGVDQVLPIQIDITNACNLKCSHCYHPHHKNDGAIGLPEWKNILCQYKRLIERLHYRPMVIICGGEPFLSSLFEPVIHLLVELDLTSNVTIITNGNLITTDKLDVLSRLKSVCLQVSVDGPDRNRHDSIRGFGSFDRTINGIRIARSNNVSVRLLAVLSSRTTKWIPDFFALAKALDVDAMHFTRLIAVGQAKKLGVTDGPLDPLELRDAYHKIILESSRSKVRSSFNSPLYHLVFPGLGRNARFWEGLVVDFKGRLLASSRSRIVLGNAIEDGLETVFLTHKLLRDLKAGKVEVCGTCEWFSVCGGDRNAAYAASGNFLGPDPGCWKHLEK